MAPHTTGVGPDSVQWEYVAALSTRPPTVAAQRSGREAEAAAALEKFLPLAAGTPYEANALKWKNDPASRASLNLGCISCHDDGRLAPTVRRQQAAAAPKTGA